MSSKYSIKAFDPLTVPLRGSNLIEASAGTGKTYSIAILVLRLVLEKKVPIQEILMVTFHKCRCRGIGNAYQAIHAHSVEVQPGHGGER
jgi:superfamily I DNA/RNA helicase